MQIFGLIIMQNIYSWNRISLLAGSMEVKSILKETYIWNSNRDKMLASLKREKKLKKLTKFQFVLTISILGYEKNRTHLVILLNLLDCKKILGLWLFKRKSIRIARTQIFFLEKFFFWKFDNLQPWY